MKNAFARNPDGSIKTKQPCQTPGCDYPNWHICLVGKPDTTQDILATETKRRTTAGRKMPPRTTTHLDALSLAQQDRWSQLNDARNQKMAEFYKNNLVGYKRVAEEFGVAPSTAFKALKDAEAAGKITMRKPGRTLAKGAK